MNFTIKRRECRADGIFSDLVSDDGQVFVTLEHSYDLNPKIPCGSYNCARGFHRLHNMTEDFETFEVTGVIGHTNLLFHWGNYNHDSDGCILVGEAEQQPHGMDKMIIKSREAFSRFMDIQDGCESFTLTVIE